jgi:hypothetical protein
LKATGEIFMNKKEAFAKFGVTQKNERWSWSGISRDGGTLVLTLWSDQYIYDKELKVNKWSNFGCDNERWVADTGNSQRIKDISYCLENLDGKFRAIRVVPDFAKLPDRVIDTVNPILHLEWHLTDFNADTGECSGESFPERRVFSR